MPEFAFIQEQANKLGVKVYLFGGTASAFAHYVRWDLEREAGDDKYQKERFDYDFTNIYRGNQDLDIVVDGTAEQAAQLQKILKEKYPHFVGSKDAWEVRLLNAQVKDKLPLLNNYDFLNQHTDTNSTGMLAINPNKGDIVFRDLFSWEDSESQFLRDVTNGEIKFLFSQTHETTTRFKEDKNPPIFAAVRYLAKLAQYEVKGTPGDLDLVKKIIRETNWKNMKSNSYVKHKLEEFGKKVLLNAPDSEYAWNLLESTGLRERLIEMDGNQTNEDTLSWWMNKEPLRSKEIGSGNGETASEIFKGSLNKESEIIVAHETNSFLAYENITRSSKGKANAFISRENTTGEAAMLGDGFYTKVGIEGARGTGLTIRFKLHPDAREGTDFIYSGDFIVIRNKNALALIQEELNITPVDFLKLLTTGDLGPTDKGLIEKFKRKFDRLPSSSKEIQAGLDFINDHFSISDDFPEEYAFNLKRFGDTLSFSELIPLITEQNHHYFKTEIVDLIKNKSFWYERPELIKALIKKGILDKELARYGFSQWDWRHLPDLLKMLIDNGNANHEIIEYVLSQKHWKNQHQLVEYLIEKEEYDYEIILHILSKEHYEVEYEWIKTLINRGLLDYEIIMDILSKKSTAKYSDLVQLLLDRGTNDEAIAMHILDKKYWSDREDWVKTVLDRGNADEQFIIHVLTKRKWKNKSSWVKTVLDRGSADEQLVRYILTKGHWSKRFEWVKTIIERGEINAKIIQEVLSQRNWKNRPQLIQLIIDTDPTADWAIVVYILSEKHWDKHPEWIDTILKRSSGSNEENILRYVFGRPDFDVKPRWVKILVERGRVDSTLLAYTLSKKQWENRSDLVDIIFRRGKKHDLMLARILVEEHWANQSIAMKWLEEIVLKNKSQSYVDRDILKNKIWQEKKEISEILNGEEFNYQNLRAYFVKKRFKKITKKAVQTSIKKITPNRMHGLFKTFLNDTPSCKAVLN